MMNNLFSDEEHDTTGYKGMPYLTRTPDLLVEVNNREGMEVEKLVKETAINVIHLFLFIYAKCSFIYVNS